MAVFRSWPPVSARGVGQLQASVPICAAPAPAARRSQGGGVGASASTPSAANPSCATPRWAAAAAASPSQLDEPGEQLGLEQPVAEAELLERSRGPGEHARGPRRRGRASPRARPGSAARRLDGAAPGVMRRTRTTSRQRPLARGDRARAPERGDAARRQHGVDAAAVAALRAPRPARGRAPPRLGDLAEPREGRRVDGCALAAPAASPSARERRRPRPHGGRRLARAGPAR